MKNHKSIIELLLLFTFMGAITSTLAKIVMGAMPPFYSLAFRYLFAAVILLLFKWKQLRLSFQREQIKAIFVVGAVFTGGFILYNEAIVYTTVTNACFYYSTSVLIIPFLARLLNKTRFHYQIFAGILITLIGMYFLMCENGSLTLNFGDILALGSAVFFAFHVVLTGKYIASCAPVVMAEGQFLILAATCFCIALLWEPFAPVFHAASSTWLCILFAASFGTVGVYLTQGYAQTTVSETTIGLIYALMPLFTALSSWVLLDERLSLQGKVGAGLMVLGVILAGKLNSGLPAKRFFAVKKKNLVAAEQMGRG